jgi:hypothetical protein
MTEYRIMTIGVRDRVDIPIADVYRLGLHGGDEEQKKIGQLFADEGKTWEFYFHPNLEEHSEVNGILRFSKKVRGEVRPFSISVTKESAHGASGSEWSPVLEIRNRLFLNRGRVYIISNVPEGKPISHFHAGPKFISRLDNFPEKELDSHDPVLLNRLERRLRGVHVGEIYGIGMSEKGHIVKIEDPELESIGLALAVASFLINTTAHVHR